MDNVTTTPREALKQISNITEECRDMRKALRHPMRKIGIIARAALAQSEGEVERGDPISCREYDGCPTEGAVLRREWRQLRADLDRVTRERQQMQHERDEYHAEMQQRGAERDRLREENERLLQELSERVLGEGERDEYEAKIKQLQAEGGEG